MNNCTLLLSSYDGGEDLWEGFFTTLIAEWPDFNLPIVINSETKGYSFRDLDITSYYPCLNQKMYWSERLKFVLKQIKTDYILLFLEDYWLDSKVDVNRFNEILNWMDKHSDVANVCFYPLPGKNIDDGALSGFELRPKAADYKFSCQVAVWRRKDLIKYLKDKETPWEFEIIGSLRSEKYKEKFYSIKKDSPKIFSYGDPQIGCLIHRGKWNKSEVERYQKKYGIQIDTSARGYEDWDEIYKHRRLNDDSIWNKLKRPHRLARLYLRVRHYFWNFCDKRSKR